MIIERRKIDQVLNIVDMMTGHSRQKGIYGALKSTGRNFSEILSDHDEIMDRAGVLQGGGKGIPRHQHGTVRKSLSHARMRCN